MDLELAFWAKYRQNLQNRLLYKVGFSKSFELLAILTLRKKQMRRSQAENRWEMIATLSRLGWSPEMIGRAIQWSSQTVSDDIKGKGGADSLFPNRPHGKAKVYAATFKFWLDHRKNARDSMMDAIEGHLQIDRIIGFAEGMMSAYNIMNSTGQKDPSASYGKVQKRSDLWAKYVEEASARRYEAPSDVGQAIGALQQAFVRLVQSTMPNQSRPIAGRPQVKTPKWDLEVLSRNVSTLKLPARGEIRIRSLGIETIGQLIQCRESDLLKVDGIGPKTLHQIRDALAELELSLGTILQKTVADRFPLPRQVTEARRRQTTL